jgi:hypothetical protein
MSKNKYESFANTSKSKEPEKSESPSPQPAAQPAPESQVPKGKDPTKYILLFFAMPVVLIAVALLSRGGCQ